MLFWAARSVMRNAGKSSNRGVQRPKPTPDPKNKSARGAIIAVIVVCICMALIVGTPNLLWMWVVPIVVIPPIWFIGVLLGASPDRNAGQRIMNLKATTTYDEVVKTHQLQERIRKLEEPPVRTSKPPRVTAPVRVASRSAVTVPVPRRRTSINDLLSDEELTERMKRIAGILLASCPVCGAGEAEFCTYVADARVSLLDRERAIVAHDARIGAAIKQGTSQVQDVVAQFENHVPDSVWEAAL
jgi:hypothetical protein